MREYLANGNHQLCIYGFTSLTFEADGMLAQLWDKVKWQIGFPILFKAGEANPDSLPPPA